MAKKRTLNEYRQTKEYQGSPWDTSKYGGGFKYNTKEEKLKKLEEAHKIPEEIKDIQKEYSVNDITQAKRAIIDKIIKHFEEWAFEMAIEEMHQYYLFHADNYLTEAGIDEFEDVWFEWYHNHHGDILYEVKKNLFE